MMVILSKKLRTLFYIAFALGTVFFTSCATTKRVKLPASATEAEKREAALKLFKEGSDLLFVNNQEALAKFDNASELDPTLTPAFYNAGVALEALDRLKDASSRYERCLAQKKEDQSCLGNLLLVKAKLNSLSESKALSEEYLTSYPSKPFALVAAAELALYEKDYEKASKLAHEVLEREADNVQAQYVMARVFYERKQFKAAKWVIKNALELAPSHGGLHLVLGHTDMALGLMHDAMDDYRAAVKFHPTEEALESEALLLLKRGQSQEALEVFKKIVALRPKEYRNYLNLGNAYFANKLFEEAKESYLKALALKPEDKDIYFSLGLLFFNLKPKDMSEIERFKTAKGYFKSYLEGSSVNKERIKEVEDYLAKIEQKIEAEEYSQQVEKEAQEASPQQEEPADVSD